MDFGGLPRASACSAQHIRNMIKRGDLAGSLLGGKLLRISAAVVAAYENTETGRHERDEGHQHVAGRFLNGHVAQMQPALTVTHLFPPIGAATIVTAVLFALMWRGHQIETRTGKDPWWLGLGLAVYALCLGAFLHFRRGVPVSGYPDIFGAAMLGEAFGVLVTFTLVQAFVAMHGKPWRKRAFPAVLGIVMTGAAFLGFFVTY